MDAVEAPHRRVGRELPFLGVVVTTVIVFPVTQASALWRLHSVPANSLLDAHRLWPYFSGFLSRNLNFISLEKPVICILILATKSERLYFLLRLSLSTWAAQITEGGTESERLRAFRGALPCNRK